MGPGSPRRGRAATGPYPGSMPRPAWTLALAALVAPAACRAPERGAPVQVSTWGSLREVLREGRSEGRVALAAVVGPRSVGLGALEGLAGEVTVIDGRARIATPVPAARPGEAPVACTLREARTDDRAALLVLADVAAWEAHALGATGSYEALEDAIAAALLRQRRDLTEPLPVRIRGRARALELHVLAGACPIAQPDGPPPWRGRVADVDAELVGVFAEDAAGRLSHHGRRTHLHAVAGEEMGHLDEVALDDAVLLLPALPRRTAPGPTRPDGASSGRPR